MKISITIFCLLFNASLLFSQSGWFPLTSPDNSGGIDMHFINSKTGFIITYNSGFLKTTNGGINWSLSPAPNIDNTSSLFFINASTGFLSQAQFIYKTTNAGANWTPKYEPTFNAQLEKIRFLNPLTGYACGDYRTVVKTTNGGENWYLVLQSTSQPIDQLYNIFIMDDLNVYVCGNSFFSHPVFFRTYDGGTSWSGSFPGTSEQIFRELFFTNPNNGYMVGGGNAGSLFKTSNAGNNWTHIVTNPPIPYITCCKFFNENTGYLGSSSGTIYKTVNGGTTLTVQYSLMQGDEMKQIFFTGTDTGYAIHRQAILKTITGGNVGINTYSNTVADNFFLSQNYPNPFNPQTRINYELPITDYVSLKVYDALGNEVQTLVNEKQNAGSYSIDYNAASLPSGIYFYKLVTEKFSDTKKMVLIK